MKVSYEEESAQCEFIGSGEKEFFRALVDVNGFYPKQEHVVIKDVIENYGDITIKAQKNGSVVIVSIKVEREVNEKVNPFSVELEGEKGSGTVSVIVLKDNGSVEEIIQECISLAEEKLSIPNVKEIFKKKQSVSYDIYRQVKNKKENNRKTATYGSVERKFFISPILQERCASDCVVTVTSEDKMVKRIEIEQGFISPDALNTIIEYHLQ